jgi:hypothetical protein
MFRLKGGEIHGDWKPRLASRLALLPAPHATLMQRIPVIVPIVNVWFDTDRLRTGDRFRKEIQDTLSNTRILVAVLSPAYLKSQFCMEEELDWFQNSATGRSLPQAP